MIAVAVTNRHVLNKSARVCTRQNQRVGMFQNGDHRITSYNVCYTKLLRGRAGLRRVQAGFGGLFTEHHRPPQAGGVRRRHSRLHRDPVDQTTEGYYVSAGYRFTDWLEVGSYYSVFYGDKDDRA